MNNIKFISNELNVSDATIRNWIKLGIISNQRFSSIEISDLKNKIRNKSFDKLVSRANKNYSTKKFIPFEYFFDTKNISETIQFIDKLNEVLTCFSVEQKMFFTSILYLKKNDFFVLKKSIQEILYFLNNEKHKKQILIELSEWYAKISFSYSEKLENFFNVILPNNEPDFLGIIYQSLKNEGDKSSTGSYYTPHNLVKNIVDEYVETNFKVLDPACGTGQFLLQFSDKINNPNLIYGFDIDKISVIIARINLMIKFKNINFKPKVFEINSVFESINTKFDFIATNPPWGAYFSKSNKKILIDKYPNISSYEIFSYFINNSLKILKNNGILSFILPVSFLNVKIHKDIRKIIVKNTTILKIFEFGRIFENVFTDVIRIDVKNNKSNENKIEINNKNIKYKIYQNEFTTDDNFTFYTKISPDELKIIKKIHTKAYFTLKNNAVFGLGIVTGNNNKFLSKKIAENLEPIIKGRDLESFFLKKASFFIKFEPENLQQVAPINIYHSNEKLIYKFISKNLVFAYDNKQNLTLNSANILIPKVENYNIKIFLGLLNSKLYNFLFQKKYNTIKILRSHIESLPLPILTEIQKEQIEHLVNEILETKIISNELDNYICNIFNLSNEEKNIIM